AGAASARYVEPDEAAPEVALAGGEVTTGVVRVGATVRRPVGFNAPLVHALLTHLESVGFAGAPRFLGVDAAGREVLSFVAGEVAGHPKPPWIGDEARLVSVGRLVRAYHDAVTGFVLPDGVVPYAGMTHASPPDLPPAPGYPIELIGHMDLSPGNTVFRDSRAVALIDFDLARPASRVDELHNAMLHWAPLGDPVDADPLLREVDVPRRCRVLADAYEMSEQDRARLVEVAVLRARRAWYSMKHIADAQGGGWARMWRDGVGDEIKRREAWLERHASTIDLALTASS
ncbi:MAG: hypothetical protein QOD96_3001, partial [Pseudonocardiales bacterium]|nr:hypothetical protein [Pseudonocardiales bacterium]